jgi:hypothetical protein
VSDGFGVAIGLVIISIGLVLAFYGWKIHKLLIQIIGFFIGGILGAIALASLVSSGEMGIIGFFGSGILCAYLSTRIEKAYIALLAGFTGASIVSQLTRVIQVTQTPWVPQYGLYMPTVQTQYNIPAIILTFIVCMVLGWLFYKVGWMVLTAAWGAVMTAVGVWTMGSMEGMLPTGLVVFVIGTLYQMYHEKGLTKLALALPAYPQAIGTGLYFIAMLVYVIVNPQLAIWSFIFLILSLHVIDKLQKKESPPYLRNLYLLLGIAGLPFALILGGVMYLYSYVSFETIPTQTKQSVEQPTFP